MTEDPAGGASAAPVDDPVITPSAAALPRGDAPGDGSGRSRIRRRRRRRWPWGVLVVLVLLGLAGAWLVVLGRRAERELQAVRADITQLRTAVANTDSAAIPGLEADLARHAHAAADDTDDPIWRAGAAVPVLGSDLHVARGLAQVGRHLADTVLPPLADSVTNLRPSVLRTSTGGVNTDTIDKAATAVDGAVSALSQAVRDVAGLDQHVHVAELDRARTQLSGQLTAVQAQLTSAQQALQLLGPMLGDTGKKRYFLAFQELNEARGTGGLIGSYAVVDADHGTLSLERAGSDSDLQDPATLQKATVDIGPDVDTHWMDYGPRQDYFVANLTPHFPWAAALLADHYDKQFGGTLDGVIALDPITLSRLLGPDTITLGDGSTATGATIAQLVMVDLYAKYPQAEDAQRKALLTSLARSAFDQVKSAPPQRVLDALRLSAGDGHLQVWSADPAQQAKLAATPVASAMPDAPGPFAWLQVTNTGPKTDYWVDRKLSYTTTACPTGPLQYGDQPDLDINDPLKGQRGSTIVATLTNNVPLGEPDVIGKDSDDPSAPYGRGHSLVSIYVAEGATLESADVNGEPVAVAVSAERGHAVFDVDLLLPRGVPQVVTLHLVEPAGGAVQHWRAQPLVQSQVESDTVTSCGVPAG